MKTVLPILKALCDTQIYSLNVSQKVMLCIKWCACTCNNVENISYSQHSVTGEYKFTKLKYKRF